MVEKAKEMMTKMQDLFDENENNELVAIKKRLSKLEEAIFGTPYIIKNLSMRNPVKAFDELKYIAANYLNWHLKDDSITDWKLESCETVDSYFNRDSRDSRTDFSVKISREALKGLNRVATGPNNLLWLFNRNQRLPLIFERVRTPLEDFHLKMLNHVAGSLCSKFDQTKTKVVVFWWEMKLAVFEHGRHNVYRTLFDVICDFPDEAEMAFEALRPVETPTGNACVSLTEGQGHQPAAVPSAINFAEQSNTAGTSSIADETDTYPCTREDIRETLKMLTPAHLKAVRGMLTSLERVIKVEVVDDSEGQNVPIGPPKAKKSRGDPDCRP